MFKYKYSWDGSNVVIELPMNNYGSVVKL